MMGGKPLHVTLELFRPGTALPARVVRACGTWLLGLAVRPNPLMRLGLGIGAPLVAAVIWGLFVAPRASIVVPSAVRLVIEVAIFGLATLGLVAAGRPHLALALGIAYVLDRVLLVVADQQTRTGRGSRR